VAVFIITALHHVKMVKSLTLQRDLLFLL